MTCPLCKSEQSRLIETISTADIAEDYLRKFNVNVSSSFANVATVNYLNCEQCDLFYFDPLVAGDQRFYEDFQKFDWYYPDVKNEFSYAASFISAQDRVLEVGSGKGSFARHIKAGSYRGLEFSENAIAMAKKNGITVLNESIQDHSSKHLAEYDIVCNFQVLEHVVDIHEFLRACVTSLKTGGKLIISVPSYDSFSRLVSNFELDAPPHHVSRWTDKALTEVAKIFSLSLTEIWHEPLQETHREFYTYSVIFNLINKLTGGRPSTYDMSITTRIRHKVSRIGARFLAKYIANAALFPRGISVTAIYTKN